jgi:hypothetical protein
MMANAIRRKNVRWILPEDFELDCRLKRFLSSTRLQNPSTSDEMMDETMDLFPNNGMEHFNPQLQQVRSFVYN